MAARVPEDLALAGPVRQVGQNVPLAHHPGCPPREALVILGWAYPGASRCCLGWPDQERYGTLAHRLHDLVIGKRADAAYGFGPSTASAPPLSSKHSGTAMKTGPVMCPDQVPGVSPSMRPHSAASGAGMGLPDSAR